MTHARRAILLITALRSELQGKSPLMHIRPQRAREGGEDGSQKELNKKKKFRPSEISILSPAS